MKRRWIAAFLVALMTVCALDQIVGQSVAQIATRHDRVPIKQAVAQDRRFNLPQMKNPVASSAKSAALSNDAAELYYDDTWQGYVGAWPPNRHGSLWSVLLTLGLSLTMTIAGYWIFGRAYSERLLHDGRQNSLDP
jgi:hypothetical protein